MYARVATFESDPANVDDAISMVRAEVESGDTPAGLEGAKMLMLVNRETGKGLGVTLFESEEAMRRGDEALNAMNPGASERRTSVEFYEVPVQTVRLTHPSALQRPFGPPRYRNATRWNSSNAAPRCTSRCTARSLRLIQTRSSCPRSRSRRVLSASLSRTAWSSASPSCSSAPGMPASSTACSSSRIGCAPA